MTKEEHNKIIDFVNSDDYMLLNSYISKPYEETIIEQDKEIERLNNIINELEKWLDKKLDTITSRLTCEPDIRDIKPLNSNRDLLIALKDKLKELKEGKNE